MTIDHLNICSSCWVAGMTGQGKVGFDLWITCTEGTRLAPRPYTQDIQQVCSQGNEEAIMQKDSGQVKRTWLYSSSSVILTWNSLDESWWDCYVYDHFATIQGVTFQLRVSNCVVGSWGVGGRGGRGRGGDGGVTASITLPTKCLSRGVVLCKCDRNLPVTCVQMRLCILQDGGTACVGTDRCMWRLSQCHGSVWVCFTHRLVILMSGVSMDLVFRQTLLVSTDMPLVSTGLLCT